MKKFTLIICTLLLNLVFSAQSATLSNADQVKNCNFSKTDKWWQVDFASLPANVANNPVTKDNEFCEFYQFAQDYFLYLLSPSTTTTGQSNWQNQQTFPLLETAGTDSCDDEHQAHSFNIRTAKDPHDNKPFVIPSKIDQADAGAIYDQEGNVVFYEIRFSKNLCDYKTIQYKPNFPGKTIELKMAWRVMNDSDNSASYYQTTANIDGNTYQLGMVGWHIVIAADNHPEFVWATLDHVENAVSCADISSGESAYDFTSQACAQDKNKCHNLNDTFASTDVKLPAGTQPNDICQVYPYGTVKSNDIDTRDGLNIALIKKLNNELQNTIFKAPNLPTSLAVWKNYQFTGALWVSEPDKGDAEDNQRGSLKLANTVMETQFQDIDNGINCFGCHAYSGTESNTSNTAILSHIFDDIIAGQKSANKTSKK
ncbi:MAG: hypothetical protein ACJAV1_001925 [Paraglaciecola sp.]|jgi:hypothetical protein